MKVALASDIHLEFGTVSLQNKGKADVLILSGDICLANSFTEKNKQFFSECSKNFPHVIYIMGNHEHYHGDIDLSQNLLKENLEEFENVYVLEKETKVINDYTFVCGTLWTDLNKNDPITVQHIASVMNDYVTIRKSGSKLKVQDTYNEHLKTLDYFRSIIDANKNAKYVVVGHHAPSRLSIKPRYENDMWTNGAYSSDLSEFILERPQIKLWTHGHTHDVFDYVIGETRIACNPRGYIGYERRADEFELKFMEI